MPIVRRTPGECFGAFRQHLAKLVARTLTERHPVQLIRQRGGRSALLSFRDNKGPVGIPINTRRGRIYLYVWHLMGVEPDGKRFRLTTREYAYRLQEGPSRQEDRALIRWEYRSSGQPSGYARHHVQMSGAIESETLGKLDLEELHLPTGRVTIEEVIRFLVTDLGFEPLCGENWNSILEKSERRFYEEYE